MANTNAAGVEYLGDKGADGTSLGQSTAAKVSVYGVTPVVQASSVADATTSVTTALFNSLKTAIQNFGIAAAP